MGLGVRRLGVGCVAVLALTSVAASASATMQVNTTSDSPITSGDGQCSLREAITAVDNGANSADCGTVAPSGATTITVPAGHYVLSLGELHVTGSAHAALVGSDSSNPSATTIDGGGLSRVLEIDSNANAQLQALEVTGGHTANSPDATAAGAYAAEADDGGGILNNGHLTIQDVAVIDNTTGRGGRGGDGADGTGSTGAQAGGGGGGGGEGAGIYNGLNGNLTVTDSTISGNVTGGGGGGGNGGSGTSSGSGAVGGPGGVPGRGGGIFNWGNAAIHSSTIGGNSTGRGGIGGGGGMGGSAAGTGADGGQGGNAGVLYSSGGSPTYAATLGGGGIANQGSLLLDESTVSGNSTGAGGNGGDAGNGGTSNGSTGESGKGGNAGSGGLGAGLLSVGSSATLTNDTFSGNVAGDGGTGGGSGDSVTHSLSAGNGGFGGYGAGIWAGQDTFTGNTDAVTLTNVTIAGNTVGAAGLPGATVHFAGIAGGRGLGAGLAIDTGASVSENETLIANNGVPSAGDQNCNSQGTTITGAYDLSYPDTTCPGISSDPLLGTLANNGGATLTLLPGAGSPAVNAVPLSSCQPSVDQRGEPRPSGSLCDIGAVERQPTDTGGAGSGTGATGGGTGATGGGTGATGGGTGATGSGGSTTGTGGSGGGSGTQTTTGPSSGQVSGALAALLKSAAGKLSSTSAILKANGVKLTLTSPGAGRLLIRWFATKHGGHESMGSRKQVSQLIAGGSVSCRAAGKVTAKVTLTAVGKKLLRHNRTLRISESASFTPTGGKTTTVNATVTLGRK